MRLKIPLTFTLIVALVIALAPLPARAAGTLTITIGPKITLTNRLLIRIPVTIVCDPLPNTPVYSSVGADIQQASGKQINRGYGYIYNDIRENSPPTWTCDGVTKNLIILELLPDSNSGPFHGGPAIIRVQAAYQTAALCGSNYCWSDLQTDYADTGFISVTIK